MPKSSFQEKLLAELAASQILTPQRYEEYLNILAAQPENFLNLLENDPLITGENLAQIKAKVLNLSYLNLEGQAINQEALKILPQHLAENYRLLIFKKSGDELSIALADPANYRALEAVEFLARKRNWRIKYFVISPASLKLGLKNYENIKEEVGEALGFAQEKFAPERIKAREAEAEPLEEIVKSAPVSKIVSVILRHAIEGGASDIHLEPQGDKSRVRYRIDGILHTSIVLPIYVHAALISRVKVIANLKIDETRIPQDGRIRLRVGDKDVDFRVSLIPLLNQEKAVLRILESPDKAPTFEDLGFRGKQIELMERNLSKPNGMFLITGPTGSGKSTTLFSGLSLLNKEGVNISTLEDPVEYYIPGVNQSQVRAELGYTFATGLRALLRQDPDVIMVGEIRDKETAALAVHAALTGHMVLSTLHTNDARGAIPRFMDMGAEPFLLANTLNLIVAQRLIRKICDNCKVKDEVPIETKEEIVRDLADMPEAGWYSEAKANKSLLFYKGSGCSQCGHSGYRGRLAIAEVFTITTAMREIVAQGFPSKAVEEELKRQNFISLKQDGWQKTLLSLTTVEEILRVTKTEE